MILRWTTLLWLVSFAVAVGLVFQIKYAVQHLEDQLAYAQARIHNDREALHILRAEWSYLNSPDRLASLAERHLKLAPIPAERMIGFADLPYPGSDEEEEAPQPEAKLPPTLVAVPAALPGGQSQ